MDIATLIGIISGLGMIGGGIFTAAAAAGAGTQAKLISKHYKLLYLDTGKIYRLLGYYKIKNSKNIVMIDNEKDNTVDKHNGKEQFDVIYLDITNNQNLEAETLKHETNLKNLGFIIIIFQSVSKTNDSSFKNQINNIINHSALSLQLIQEVNLADFFKSNMMVVLQKTEKSFSVI